MTKARSLFVLLPFLALLLAACGAAGATSPPPPATPTLTPGLALAADYEIRPIDDIIDGELTPANFANDGTALLPIHTNVPVACSVVYGETPAFGSLSLDQDMAGGTHSDHSPLLRGLEPETQYYFRVQGVDDNGVVYLSEVMTFTTPPLSEDAATIENLASPEMGAVILDYSSAYGNAGVNDPWGPANAFDDNPNTAWSSAGDGDNAWVEVQLARPANIESIEVQTRAMSDGSAITLAFTVTTDQGETFGPFQLPDASQMYRFDLNTTAQILRLNLVETTGGNTGLVDVAVFGEFLN